MKTAVFHPGTQHSRQTALALQDLGRLAFLATGLFDHADSRLRRAARLLPSTLRRITERELGRYAAAGLDPALVRVSPSYELPERIVARMGMAGLARRLDAAGNTAFGRRIAALALAEAPLALWGYDGSSFAAFADPRAAGCPKILDRTVADGRFWNEERERIAQTHGDWLAGGTPRWSDPRIATDELEYRHADRIVCGSPFVAETIARYSHIADVAQKLEVLPYSFDAALFGNAPEPVPSDPSEPMRLLFVGQVSARKGVQHLLEAMAHIPASTASLTLAGPLMVPGRLLAPYRDRVRILGPVARVDVPALMQRHHAFIFPSHFEGSAVVLVEAMASGLAIVQTSAAGLGASERSGILLNRADAGCVEEAIVTLAADRERLQAMRRASQEEAGHRDFSAYRASIAALLERMQI